MDFIELVVIDNRRLVLVNDFWFRKGKEFGRGLVGVIYSSGCFLAW